MTLYEKLAGQKDEGERKRSQEASDEASEAPPTAWLWVTSLAVILALSYSLWTIAQEPSALANTLSGFQPSVEEGPIIASSPNHIAPAARVTGEKMPLSGEQLSGVWTYRIDPNEAPAKWSYATEYVHMKLEVKNGSLSGSYRSRYKVPNGTNRTTENHGEVHFEFRGPAGASTFDWVNREAKGQIHLNLQAGGTMDVSWKTTCTGTIGGLAAGSTRLNREIHPIRHQR